MANTRNYQNRYYNEKYVHGSVAYDPAVELQEEREQYVRIPPRQNVQEGVVSDAVRLTRQNHVSLPVVLGFIVAAVLLVVSLIARIQFTTVSAEAAELQSQVNELTETNARLTIQYETALNLTEVEDYAINTLGMQKPRADQIQYVNGTSSDKATILTEETAAAETLTNAEEEADVLLETAGK